MKILAVDDDENIRDLLTASVEAETDHQIVTAESGPEAIRLINEADDPFDCFLLDIQMPVMNGITLCEKIRKTPGYRRTPIVMLTAMSQKKYIDRAFSAGATDYVTKPFDFLELFSRIKNAERLFREQARNRQGMSEVAALKKDLDKSMEHSLNEPIEISGIERVVGYVSFENYLMQLSRARLLRLSVFGVKIANAEQVFEGLSHLAFRQLLTDVASYLSDNFNSEENLITYRGAGVFLVAVKSRNALSQHAFEMMLNARVGETSAVRMSGQPVRMCVGETVSLMSLTRAGALFSLQQAVENAEYRSSNQKEVMRKLQRIIRSRRRSDMQSEMERRAYEVLLRDSMRDDPSASGAFSGKAS
ncbi:response regulator [Shimia biformata]|uniref:response regulator n=1 Tax=Shimia biformata TaxID=1294299 RepID=UPI00194EA561|nr:response regulator [Shimia biformata]